MNQYSLEVIMVYTLGSVVNSVQSEFPAVRLSTLVEHLDSERMLVWWKIAGVAENLSTSQSHHSVQVWWSESHPIHPGCRHHLLLSDPSPFEWSSRFSWDRDQLPKSELERIAPLIDFIWENGMIPQALWGCTFGSSGISLHPIETSLPRAGSFNLSFISLSGSKALHLSLFATNNRASLHHKIGRIAWETVRPTCQIFLDSLWTKRDAAWS